MTQASLRSVRARRHDQETFARALRGFGIEPGTAVVAGVSGGVDSTVLARLVHAVGYRLIVAHVDYGLRGEESDGDREFVTALAEEMAVPVHVRRARPPGETGGGLEPVGNLQENARDLRYRFFEEVARAEDAAFVAVGSTMDDQAETVLLHLFRGSGPRGTAGMPAQRAIARGSTVRLVRPLLRWPRSTVEEIARSQGWSWREDASNVSSAYRRNALRNEVLPVIRRHFGEDVAERIAASAARVGAWAGAPGLILDALEALGPGLPVDSLRALPEEVRHGLYVAALARHAPAAPRNAAVARSIDALLDTQTGRRVVVGPAVVWRDRDRLVVAPALETAAEAVSVAPAGVTETPWGTISIEPADATELGTGGPNEVVVDARVLEAGLELRPWAAGDTFEPLGGTGTRRVSDVLTDARVPPHERARQLVLVAGGRVVWVVGHRQAELARVGSGGACRLTWWPAVVDQHPPSG